MDWIATSPKAMGFVLLTAIFVYIGLVTLTRVCGVRSFSKMSGFDFAITVAIGSVVASVIMGKTPTLSLGLWILAVMFALQIGFATLRYHFPQITRITDNDARVIMIGDQMQPDQMRKAKITESDLRAKLREANVLTFAQIKVVIAETTGDVSVVHADQKDSPLDLALLDGVIGQDRVKAYYDL